MMKNKIINFIEREKKPIYIRNYIIIACLLLMLIMTIKGAFALSWEEQKVLAKELGYKNNYKGGFRFAYYETRIGDNGVSFYATYRTEDFKHKNSLITFYLPSVNLNKHDTVCLILHELGHNQDVKNGNKNIKLNESFADDYMVSKDNTCNRWYG